MIITGQDLIQLIPTGVVYGVYGLIIGAVVGLVGVLVFGREVRVPSRVGSVSIRRDFLSSRFVIALMGGMLRGFFFGLTSGFTAGFVISQIVMIVTRVSGEWGSPVDVLYIMSSCAVPGTIVGFSVGIVVAVNRTLTRPDLRRINPMAPLDSWRGDSKYGLIMGLLWHFSLSHLFHCLAVLS